MTRSHERAAIDLLEEAVSLLRSAPAGAVATYLLGAAPFLLAFLFFLADMNRSPFASEHLPWASLAVALLYVWKNIWQALFMAKLYGIVSPSEAPPPGRWQAILMQAALQPVGLLFPIPLSWTVAFFRNVALYEALGRHDAVSAARRQSMYATGQNWTVLAIVLVGSVLLFLNVLMVIVFLPQLGRSLLGIEGDLVRLGMGILNLTTLSVAGAITWLAVDPLLDAVYVLRCFYGESVASGADLRAALKRATALVALLVVAVTGAHAQSIDEKKLDQAIDQVIHQREFTWRAPRTAPEPQGKWVSWYRAAARFIQQAWDWIWDRIREWFQPQKDTGGADKTATVNRKAMLALMSVIVALIVAGIVLFLMRRKRGAVVSARAVASAAPAVNLADESLTADRLPESEWLAMADEFTANGDFRLALRALYLAALNYLSARDLISLRRWKTGLDYRRELARRARATPDLPRDFSQGVAIFEEGWYGRHPVDRAMADALASGFNQMRAHAK
ncbi:MAG TPA: DUF4129 domain-containing protein [Bryobacteraceae bacterium]|nr:DUF4129 domain-containing protein [Bryobacteraceae bacterium]